MISNLPVISTTVGGIPYQINDDCGILINPNSPRDLASAMRRLINKPEDFIKMGNNAKKRVLKNFTWSKSASIVKNEYSKILSTT